ncbi:MAG: HAMP domain-containing sensor histidine kinase [Clostridiaceae bacterium]|nr:HAMP domain-containing sensor histidine kinase [Clostridiaceae bacterium]
MKSKKVLKLTVIPLIYLLISFIFALSGLIIIKHVVDYVYRTGTSSIINNIVNLWHVIRKSVQSKYLNELIVGILTLIIYLVLIYPRNERIVSVLEDIEEMSEGNLDKQIKIGDDIEIKTLSQNINSIVKQLKEKTVEEKKAQKIKNDLITNVSHDLRTPLTSIIGYLEIIEKDKYRDEVQLRYYTDIVYSQAKRLKVLIDDLFELTKMQNKGVNLEKRPLNLVELLGQVVGEFQYQFHINNMQERVNFSEDKLFVLGDAEKLVRAFENLISNSIKYGRDGHYVDIVTKRSLDYAIVQVINYGEEISPVDLEYIFERFYRVDKSRNSKVGGSGLGLAITKNVIELHGGEIKAFSNEERTMFEVKIPLKNC